MAQNATYALWSRLAGKPGGKQLFSAAMCLRVPYFRTVLPSVRGTGAGGFRGGAGRGTTGTVERVEDSTVYVKTMQGTEAKVSTSDSTTVGLAQPGKLTDLKPGATASCGGNRARTAPSPHKP